MTATTTEDKKDTASPPAVPASAHPPEEPDAVLRPTPPLVIGVSGLMEFRDGCRETVRAAVKQFLLRFHSTAVGPPDPGLADWPVLPHTPIVLLSALAPGADWLLVDLFDELEHEYQGELDNLTEAERKARLPWRYKVYAPLPFPPEQYEQASTFTKPRGPQAEADKKAALARMKRMWEERHAFHVPLKEDHEACEGVPEAGAADTVQVRLLGHRKACLNGRLEADLRVKERYRLRYRAAGEYIAAHSHLTLILNDQTPACEESEDAVRVPILAELKGEFKYGSEVVLQLKRQGITPELLRSEVAFTWADSGPVAHFYTPRPKAPEGAHKPGTLTVLYPVDTRPHEGKPKNDDHKWLETAGEKFGSTLDQLEAFNRRTWEQRAETAKKEAEELGKAVGAPAANGREVVREYADGLDRLARARRRASHLSDNIYSKEWRKLLLHLFLFTLLAAALVHLANHFHIKAAHPSHPPTVAAGGHHPDPAHPDPAHPNVDHPETDLPPEEHRLTAAGWLEVCVRLLLTAAAMVVLLLAYRRYRDYKRSKHEGFRYDYRAVAEGLRVQLYWAAAGLPQSVPANYMQRQRNEMVWMRRAITALAAPYTRWADGFAGLTESEQLAQLKTVVRKWVRWDRSLDPDPPTAEDKIEEARREPQAGYMELSAYKEHRSETFWKRLGIDLAAAALLHLLIWVLLPVLHPLVLALLAALPPDVAGWLRPVLQVFGLLGTFPAWLSVLAGLLFVGFVVLWVIGGLKAAARHGHPGHQHGFPKASPWAGVKSRFWANCWGGFEWARAVLHPAIWLWEALHLDEKRPREEWRERQYRYRRANVIALALLTAVVTGQACVLLGSLGDWWPGPHAWWGITYGLLFVTGGLAFAWPERNLKAEHARQYESMWAMFQAAGRRLAGHIQAAEDALNGKPATATQPEQKPNLVLFRGRVKAIQEVLYQVGLQALDENAEWLILHRSRPLEPLMAG